MRLPINLRLALVAPIILAGLASSGALARKVPVAPVNGPADDYPVVIGDPFTIDGTTHTPEDRMNYDAVGYAVAGEGSGVVVAHKILPLPSYAEVTNLETGRTIVVRVTMRGPMQNDALIAVSPATAAGLGIAEAERTAVRVRRVNPPEVERANLRAGEPVPPRMDTPVALLAALKRKLASQEQGGAPVYTPKSVIPDPDIAGTIAPPELKAAPIPKAKPKVAAIAAPKVDSTPATPNSSEAKGTFVQIGAFSTEDNAKRAAAPLDAGVSKVGKFWVARMGPLSGKAETNAALAKARAAGYGGAMVRRVN